MMRWRRARVAAHRLFSAKFARKDRQPRNKISRLGVCQPLHCAQIEPLDKISLIGLIYWYDVDPKLLDVSAEFAAFFSMFSVCSFFLNRTF